MAYSREMWQRCIGKIHSFAFPVFGTCIVKFIYVYVIRLMTHDIFNTDQ